MSIACAGCGKFIAYADIDAGRSHCDYEPLSDFGPERIEHVCPACITKENQGDQASANNAPDDSNGK